MSNMQIIFNNIKSNLCCDNREQLKEEEDYYKELSSASVVFIYLVLGFCVCVSVYVMLKYHK